MSQFDFTIRHKPGKLNSNADALSRLVVNKIDTIINQINDLQAKDENLKPLIHFLKFGEVAPFDKKPNLTITMSDNYFLEDDILYHIHKGRKTIIQLVIPKSIVPEVLHWCHESPLTGAHFGIAKVYDKISNKYFWQGMYRDTKFFINSCPSCGTRKLLTTKNKAPLIPFPAYEPWQKVCLDLHGPMPASRSNGHKFILCVIDSFTKYAIIKSTLGIDAHTIAKIVFEEVITRFGAPRTFLSDRGGQFTSEIFKKLNGNYL